MFRIFKRKPEPEYEVYVPEELCIPRDIDFMSGYWRCGYCGEECPMTCPVQGEDE